MFVKVYYLVYFVYLKLYDIKLFDCTEYGNGN